MRFRNKFGMTLLKDFSKMNTQEKIGKKQEYIRAKKRVEQLKSFYKHLVLFIVVNLFLIGRRIYKDIHSGDSVIEAFSDINNYRLLVFWGLALVIHAISTFSITSLFGKDWEERKIKELMNNDN